MATLDELDAIIDAERAQAASVGAPSASPIQVETPLQRGLATVGGGLLGAGDVLTFGALGNVVAGGAALPDILGGVPASEAFAQRKAQTAAMLDYYRQQSEGAGASVLGMPITEALAGLRSPIKLASTRGAAAIGAAPFVSPLIQIDVPEEERLARTGIGVATGTTLGVAGKAIGLGTKLARAVGGGDVAEKASQEILAAMTPEEAARLNQRLAAGEGFSKLQEGGAAIPKSVAEIAESPALAIKQTTLGPQAIRPLEEAAAARTQAQKEALEGIAIVPEKGETATAISNIAAQRQEELASLQKRAEAASRADESDLIGMIGDDLRKAVGDLPPPSETVRKVGETTQQAIKTARNTAKNEARALWEDPEVYNVRADIKGYGDELQGVITGFQRTGTQAIGDPNLKKQIERLSTAVSPVEAQAVKGRNAKVTITPTRVSLGFLHDVQSELGDIVRKIKPGEATQDQALALQVHQSIQKIIDNTPGTEKLGVAKDAWRNYFDTFIYDREKQRSSALKTVLRKSGEKVPGSLLSESFNYDAMRKAGISTSAIDRQALAEFSNLPTAQTKLNWIEKNRAVLSSSPVWRNVQKYEQDLRDIAAKKSDKFSSTLVDEVRKNPEGFSKQTPAAQYAVREALFQQLQTVPVDELNSAATQRLITTVFKDTPVVNEYLKAAAEGKNLAKYARITDSMIPSNVFQSEKTAQDFMRQFRGTDAEKLVQGRYIDNLKVFGKDSLTRLKNQEKIGRAILGDNYSAFEKIVKDIDDAKIVGRLERGTTENSLTQKRLTALGFLESRRAFLNAIAKTGAKLGGGAGLLSGNFMGVLGGSLVGGSLQKFAQKRLDAMDIMVGKLLADPTGLQIASAPPTKGNVEALLTYLGKKGFLVGRIEETDRGTQLSEAIGGMKESRPNNEDELLRELELLGGQKKNESMKNVSIPTGEQYAPESLVRAVMQVESGGKQSAVSPKGALGMMQLMPATARELGVNPKDPVQNVEGGSRYLKQQMNTFGDVNLALAAYNMGPGALRRAIEAAGTSNWDSLVSELGEKSRYNPDGLPAETINYVRKVRALLA